MRPVVLSRYNATLYALGPIPLASIWASGTYGAEPAPFELSMQEVIPTGSTANVKQHALQWWALHAT